MNTKKPDFEELLALYRKDPAALEEYRRIAMQEIIAAAPAGQRSRLERLVAHLDEVRQTAASPQEAARIAFAMMSDSVNQLQNAWQNVANAVAEMQAVILIESVRGSISWQQLAK